MAKLTFEAKLLNFESELLQQLNQFLRSQMKSLMELKALLVRNKSELIRKYNIREIGIFGSYATGLATEMSDIDILVEFEKPIGLDFVTLAEELENLLGVKVDLVSANAIKPNMIPSVKEYLIYV